MAEVRVGIAKLEHKSEEERMLRAAVERALEPVGGLRKQVSSGDKVLLKPNQTLFLPHTSGSTTSVPLMRVLIAMCFDAGAKEVWVAEAVGHAQQSRSVMKHTGMTAGVAGTGARVIYMDETAVDVVDFGEDAGELRYMPAFEPMLRADVLINVPKAKTHFIDPISGGCKNWVGAIPMSYRLTLQRREEAYYRGTAYYLRKFKPSLTIFDGGWAGEGQGPGANDAFWWGWVLASDDVCAADVTLARLFGLEHENIKMVNAAANLGVGINRPDDIELVGADFDEAHRKVTPGDPSVHRYPCRVIAGEGPGATMEGTLGHWKTIADGWLKEGAWRLLTMRGTPTFMFGAVEDPEFEKHLKEGPYVVLDDAALDKYKHDDRVTFVPGSPVPQSYMQNEMVEGMGFGPVYQAGLGVEKMIAQLKGRLSAKG